MNRNIRLLIGVFFIFVMLFVGSFGYVLIEGWPFVDALYMTVITLSTVGYGETHELSHAGRVFTIVFVFMSVGFAFYLAGSIVQFMMEGRIREILGRRKLEKGIKKQKNHFIVCGFGRVGSSICDELAKSKRSSIVVIDRDPEAITALEEQGIYHIAGEATDEENLIKAGIERARGLVAALKTDSDNVYALLTARELNPELFIIARAGERKSEKKLLAAGADKVVSPYLMGGHRIAQIIVRPTVTDFLELTMMHEGGKIQMEEMLVHSSSRLIDVALQDSNIRKDLNLIIVAVRKPKGDMLFNPSSQTKLLGGDTIVVIGEKENLKELEHILNPKS